MPSDVSAETPEPSDRGPGLAPGDSLDLTLTAMAYGGDAVGHAAERTVFAWGGIAGEAVRASVDRVKRDLAWATVTEVKTAAAQRVAPPCPYFGPCGGCQWQHIAYPAQLDFKSAILGEQLRRGGRLDAEQVARVQQPAAGMADPWHYRNVAHFQIDPATRRLGYFRRTSHQVVPIEVCPISDPGINSLLPGLQELFITHAQAPGDLPPDLREVDLEAVRRGQAPVAVRARKVTGMPVWQVTVRTGAPPTDAAADAPLAGRELVVVLHTLSSPTGPAGRRGGRGAAEADGGRVPVLLPRKAVRQWVGGLDGRVSVVELNAEGALELLAATPAAATAAAEDASTLTVPGLVSGSRRAAASAADADRPEPPPGVVRQRLQEQRYWLAPQAFFQVNNAQAERILELVQAALPPHVELLVDAYSGVGAFGLALLQRGQAARVVAIESDWAAVESARWTAALLEIAPERLRLERGRVEDILPSLDPAPDAVLLDPPRTGCAPALLRHLLAHPVARLIYISCDPSTLARDVRTLAPGYNLSHAQVVDMFPQTYHIETVAVFDPK